MDIGRWNDIFNIVTKSIILKDLNFLFKDILIVQPQQLFISKIDTQLLQTVAPKILKPKNIKDIDAPPSAPSPEGKVQLIQNKIECCIVKALTQCVTNPPAFL